MAIHYRTLRGSQGQENSLIILSAYCTSGSAGEKRRVEEEREIIKDRETLLRSTLSGFNSPATPSLGVHVRRCTYVLCRAAVR